MRGVGALGATSTVCQLLNRYIRLADILKLLINHISGRHDHTITAQSPLQLGVLYKFNVGSLTSVNLTFFPGQIDLLISTMLCFTNRSNLSSPFRLSFSSCLDDLTPVL